MREKVITGKRAAAVAAALALNTSAVMGVNAAEITPTDLERLMADARTYGYASVIATTNTTRLGEISEHGIATVRAKSQSRASALKAALGGEYAEQVVWENGLGQVGLLVTARGLQMLRDSQHAISVIPDVTRQSRARAWIPPDAQTAIEAQIKASGSAVFDVILASDEAYSIDQSGATLYPKERAAAPETRSVSLGALARTGASVVDTSKLMAGNGNRVTVRADLPAYYALSVDPSVRGLRVGRADAPRSNSAKLAQSETAEVALTVHLRNDNFSPNRGHMTPKAWEAQRTAQQAALRTIVDGHSLAGFNPVVDAEFGTLKFKAPQEIYESLLRSPDPLIENVTANTQGGVPTLSKTMPIINMPSAWAAGYRGAGQTIVFFDTGIRKSHQMLRNASGVTRVTFEGCFQTNDTDLMSICPSPNSAGDSPVGLVNSGLPYNSTTFCNTTAKKRLCGHGTRAAGIAAGRSSPLVNTGQLQGVAPDAAIASINVFSVRRAGDGMRGAPDDIIEALKQTLAQTIPGIVNPMVVNINMGLYGNSSADCGALHPDATTYISDLHSRGVPVVAAAGNESSSAMSWPSCVPKTIKVSAFKWNLAENPPTTFQRANYANLGNPGLFTGPILIAPGGYLDNYTGIASSSAETDTSTIGGEGTSLATPHVSGYYAAVKAAEPTLGVDDITAWIVGTGSVAFTTNVDSVAHTFRRIRAPF